MSNVRYLGEVSGLGEDRRKAVLALLDEVRAAAEAGDLLDVQVLGTLANGETFVWSDYRRLSDAVFALHQQLHGLMSGE